MEDSCDMPARECVTSWMWAQIGTGQRHGISPLMDFTHFSPPWCHRDRRQPLSRRSLRAKSSPRCKNSFTRSFFSIHESVKRRASFGSHLLASINPFDQKLWFITQSLSSFLDNFRRKRDFWKTTDTFSLSLIFIWSKILSIQFWNLK